MAGEINFSKIHQILNALYIDIRFRKKEIMVQYILRMYIEC